MIRYALVLVVLALPLPHAAAQPQSVGGGKIDEVARSKIKIDIEQFLKFVAEKVDGMSDQDLATYLSCPGQPATVNEPAGHRSMQGREKIKNRVKAIYVSGAAPVKSEVGPDNIATPALLLKPAPQWTAECGAGASVCGSSDASELIFDVSGVQSLVRADQAAPALSLMVLKAICRGENDDLLSADNAKAFSSFLYKH